jgi:pimeloyl-ACP methyl ester carboxylesterase
MLPFVNLKGATMTIHTAPSTRGGAFVAANGIDIHYVEAGRGTPLILLHGGVVSTGPSWSGYPVAYNDHIGTLAEHFRVIAPDTRSSGATRHTGGGTISFSLLADDVVALIEALHLDRPLIAGFSEGGTTATLVGIRNPECVRAIVNHAGYDLFNPQSPSFAMGRMMLSGRPDAEQADPDAAEQFFQQNPMMQALIATMKADLDDAQGPGYWRTYLELAFYRITRSPVYTFDDLRSIEVPTLVMAGDRDEFCTVEEGVTSYRMLRHGELAILPDQAHYISPSAVATMIDFLRRAEAS